MARSERQEDGTRGAVGTMTRSGARTRPPQVPDGGPAAPEPRRGRQPRPVPSPRPVTDQQAGPAQRPDGGTRAAGRRDQRAPAPAAAGQRRGGAQPATAPPRPAARPRFGAPWRVQPAPRAAAPRQARTTGPQPVAAQPQQAQPQQAQPQQAQATPATPAGPSARPSQLRQAVAGSHRMPFVLLLCGLLGGALISALVISTTLAEGSFQINKLEDATSSLAQQRQTLEEQVAQSQSAQVIAQRASQLGMRRPGESQFLNLKTGKIVNDGPAWIGAANAPGYAP